MVRNAEEGNTRVWRRGEKAARHDAVRPSRRGSPLAEARDCHAFFRHSLVRKSFSVQPRHVSLAHPAWAIKRKPASANRRPFSFRVADLQYDAPDLYRSIGNKRTVCRARPCRVLTPDDERQ
jgi:hypothetical protein